MSAPDYDILIAGGGMVGASLALALAPLGLRIAVVEAVAPDEAEQLSFDERSIALSRGSCSILHSMGLWTDIAPAATAIRHIHVSDRGHFGAVRLDAAEAGVDALGYVVISREMGRVLRRRLQQADNIDMLCPASIDSLQQQADRVVVEIVRGEGRHSLSAALLVAADGGHSRVRDLLGVTPRIRDYEQAAVIANVTTSRMHRNIAYERFTDSGPLAVLPLSQGRCAVVWTVWKRDLEAVMGMDEQQFLAALQQRFGGRLGTFSRAGERAAYPLQLIRVADPVRERAVIIGNAAHSLHPIAGQGFNLGLRDCAVLAEEIAAAGAADPGAMAILQSFRQRQAGDHRRTSGFTDTMVRLFSNQFPPLVAGRNLGLLGMELLPSLRRLLARNAMGYGGRVSRLGRGLSLPGA